jgi:hypothetical protein
MKALGVVGIEQSTGAVKVFNWKAFNGGAEFFHVK